MDENMIITEDEMNNEEAGEGRKFNFDFYEYKSIIYTSLFYLFGLFLGSYLYKITQFNSINELIKPRQYSILNLFISNFCIYFSLFLLVMFLGFCLIGYPIMNIIPTVIGFGIGVKCAYFFINYQTKGIGYSLIMLIPFAAMFVTVIAYTIQVSSELSKSLIKLTKKENTDDLQIKSSVKKYLISALFIAITSLLKACLTNLLFAVVTI